MKNFILSGLFLLAFSTFVSAQEETGKTHKGHQHSEKKEGDKKGKKQESQVLLADSIDPMCKMSVAKGSKITVNHKGKQYGFCSETCKERLLKGTKETSRH